MRPEAKRCKDCGLTKPIEDFNPTPTKGLRTGVGLRSRCRSCHSLYYQQWQLKNKIKTFEPPPEKHCSICKIIKSGIEFSRNRSAPDGLDYFCRACKHLKYVAQGRRTPEQAREHSLWRLYRIKLKDYDALMEAQKGICPVCNHLLQPGGRGLPPVDHDHKTGRLRGIVCHKCNIWLGRLELIGVDGLDRLKRYLSY